MKFRGILGLAAALGLAAPAAAQQALGKITFPTSGAAAAQSDFIRGVLLLHSFEYEEAAQAFQAAQRTDPKFVMAYWGEALTHTHQVWDQQDLPAARAALAKLAPTPAARAALAPTPRERDYLASAEILYGEGSKPRRDTLYAAALEAMVQKYPDDDEAKVFYAVALLGLNQGVRDVPTYMRAGAIAQDVFRRNDDHPGAAHFVIHAFDDPVHAPLGLYAARRYSAIAPGASHAQHMTTHIFLALGLWDDVIRQNEVASGDPARRGPGHYTHWLLYGLLQEGRIREASELLSVVAGNARPRSRGALANFRARFVAETGRWTGPEAAALAADTGKAGEDDYEYATYVAALAALRRGDRPGAEGLAAALAARPASREDHVKPGDPGSAVVPVILSLQLQAELASAAGRRDEAIAILRRAAVLEDAMPEEFGPPAVIRPSHELLGALEFEAGRNAEAIKDFERALAQGPGRSIPLLGLLRAATAEGQPAIATRAARQLATNWRRADPDLPGLREVTTR